MSPRCEVDKKISRPSPRVPQKGEGGTEEILRATENWTCWKKIPGDARRIKNNFCKQALMDAALWAHLPCDAEIFGLFSDQIVLVALEERREMGSVRARHGKVPDLCLIIPSQAAGLMDR